MPSNWKGVLVDCDRAANNDPSCTNWGGECIVCKYWGPSLEKLEDLTRSGWICLNCKLEKEYLDDLEDKNPHDPLGLGYLKCNEITFSAVLAMPITKVQRLSKQYAKVIVDLMSDQFPVWDVTSKTFLSKDKPVRTLSKVKDVKGTFQKYKGLNLPINAEVLRDLFRELESEFNVRFSSTNPVRSQADINPIHSAIMTLSTNVLQTQLDLYFTWVTATYGNVETLMGLHMTKIILRLASRSSEMTEEFAAYEAFFGLQLAPNQKLKHYKDKYDVLMQDLLLARSGKPVDERLSLHFFLIKMSKSCRMEIEKQHKTTYTGQPMDWATLNNVVETLGDMTAQDTKSKSQSINAVIQSTMKSTLQQVASMRSGQGQVMSPVQGQGGGTGNKNYPVHLPRYACDCCGSTAETPLPSGSQHHWTSACPFWNFELHCNQQGEVSSTCIPKPGCQMSEPMFDTLRKQGTVPRWLKPNFRSTRQYQFLIKKRDRVANGGVAGVHVDGSPSKKSRKSKKKQSAASSIAAVVEDGMGQAKNMGALWAEALGFSPSSADIMYHASGTHSSQLLRMPGPAGVDQAHEIFRVSPSTMGLSEEELVEFLHNVQRISVHSGDNLICQRAGDSGEFVACYLPTSVDMMVGAVTEGDASRLTSFAYNPTPEEIKQDLQLTHTTYKGSGDGACQRSIELYVPLKCPTSKATHVRWMSMLDLGAIGNFQSASLAHQIIKHTEHGKDAVVLETGLYKSPLRVTGADPSGAVGMHAVSWVKLRVHSTQLDGTQFTQDIRIDILNRSAVSCLRGASQQSKDEGYTDIHDRVIGPSSRKEAYVIRMPTNSSPGTVRLQLHRCINEWGAKIMPILPAQTDALSWSKTHRQVNFGINSALAAESDTLVRPTAESTAKTSNITYDFESDMAYIYRNEQSTSCEDIMVILDSDTEEQRLYKGRLQYEYFHSEDLSDESDHESKCSVQAPGLSQSSIPAYDANAEPWCIQCVDCDPKCTPRSVDSDTPYGSHGFNCNRIYEACKWGSWWVDNLERLNLPRKRARHIRFGSPTPPPARHVPPPGMRPPPPLPTVQEMREWPEYAHLRSSPAYSDVSAEASSSRQPDWEAVLANTASPTHSAISDQSDFGPALMETEAVNA